MPMGRFANRPILGQPRLAAPTFLRSHYGRVSYNFGSTLRPAIVKTTVFDSKHRPTTAKTTVFGSNILPLVPKAIVFDSIALLLVPKSIVFDSIALLLVPKAIVFDSIALLLVPKAIVFDSIALLLVPKAIVFDSIALLLVPKSIVFDSKTRVRAPPSDRVVDVKNSVLFANTGSRERRSLVGRGVKPHKKDPTASVLLVFALCQLVFTPRPHNLHRHLPQPKIGSKQHPAIFWQLHHSYPIRKDHTFPSTVRL